jgi:hypothetical protein
VKFFAALVLLLHGELVDLTGDAVSGTDIAVPVGVHSIELHIATDLVDDVAVSTTMTSIMMSIDTPTTTTAVMLLSPVSVVATTMASTTSSMATWSPMTA